ncbi:MAG: hypothetical protein HQK72_00360 [Desulfamplus sp.]|nr:hypothetical protein [Desulfamplus sp.]
MADQSLARSVLDKLVGIGDAVTELHESLNYIHQLKQEVNDWYSNTGEDFNQILYKYESFFIEEEERFEGFQDNYSKLLNNIEIEKNILTNEIQDLSRQKAKLSSDVEIIVQSYTDIQDRIDSALSYLHTRQTDLTTLESKLQKAFSDIDSQIDSKLDDYTSQLNQGIIDARTTINIKLDYFLSGAEEKISALENRTNKSIEQIESKSKELQTTLYNMLSNAISDLEQLLTQKMNSGLYKIEEKQTTFIDRQTSMVTNNSVIIDQMQRRFSQEITDISQQTVNTNDKINMIESGIEKIQAGQITLNETLQNLNKTISDQDERLKKLEKKPWWPW